MEGGLIPGDVIERVRAATDIVELVSGYVTLKRTGANYLGRCPFHQEKTPSFTVSPSKQIFHCFGCGAGGDAIGFLIRHENFSYPEAIRKLADRAGIVIPETRREGGPGRDEYDELFRINTEAASFFENALYVPDGSRAREYLDKRGLSPETLKDFSIGWSPNAWDTLLKHLGAKGITPAKAEKAGLAVRKDAGGHYDRFRGRVMFPIRDPRGRVVGFGGRAMGDEMPKYLNVPETALFRKGELLYAIDAASEHIRKKGFAIIVEGYMDAIACHAAGVKNAVATMGTALTASHLRLLRRWSKNVLLVFDGDPAGLKAAERSLEVFLGTDLTAKVAVLPQGDDPDSLVRREGPEGLRKRLGQSDKLMDFVIRRLAEGAKSVEEKVAASDAVVSILARVQNGVERSHYLKRAADELNVEESALHEELGKKAGIKRGVYEGPAKPAETTGLSRIEEGLLHIMLHHPEVASEVRESLSPGDFAGTGAKEILEGIYALIDSGHVGVPELLDRLEDERLKGLVLKLVLKADVGDNVKEYAEGAVQRLKEAHRKKELKELQRRIKQAEEEGDLARVNELALRLQEIRLAGA